MSNPLGLFETVRSVFVVYVFGSAKQQQQPRSAAKKTTNIMSKGGTKD